MKRIFRYVFFVVAVASGTGYFAMANQIMDSLTTHSKVDKSHPQADDVYRWLVKMQMRNGLLESNENSNAVSLYDNALAALAFTAHHDYKKAEAIFNFFDNRIDIELLAGTGGFSRMRDKTGKPRGAHLLGDNAWLLIALNNYASLTHSKKYERLQLVLAKWIRSLQDKDGGLWQSADDFGKPNKKVTENMIDAFNAVPGYDDFHKKLLEYLGKHRWDNTRKLLLSWPGNRYELALDNFAWGFCAFEDFPKSILNGADVFLCTHQDTNNKLMITGYSFDMDKDNVWYEGMGQMAVAFQKAGEPEKAEHIINEIEKGIVASVNIKKAKGIPYVTNPGTGYGGEPLWPGADVNPCVASAAWYLFSVWKFDPMQVGFSKNIPKGDRFW